MSQQEIRFCIDCDNAVDAGTDGVIDLRCKDSYVNHGSGLFLVGLVKSNKRCVAERNNVVGRCGKAGKRFVNAARSIDNTERQLSLPI